MYDKIQVCPKCRGNGFNPDGHGMCTVCDGVGALYRGDGAPARYEDADLFFQEYAEMRERRPWRSW
jgi:RecJ-like exonuclease